MSDPDFRIDKFPNRVGVAIKGIQEFIPQFYSASPLGQLGLVVMKDRRAERLVSLGGSPAEINSALQKLIKDGFKCSGQCSLINAINVSKNMLTAVGEHSNKEIIFIVGALSTVDPESPENTIQKVVTAGIRCSIVSLSAEVHLWRKLAERTSGDYFVPLDVPSIFEKLELISRPPKDTVRSHAVLIRMGFPIKEAKGKFLCPQCKNRVASLPTTCEICKLKLVSAPHLARSYHHLFPPAPSIPCIPDVPESENTPRLLNASQNDQQKVLERQRLEREQFNEIRPCVGCGFSPSSIDEGRQFVKCSECQNCICHFCDAFVDNDLHSCPGCC